jgi:hypothetical protein
VRLTSHERHHGVFVFWPHQKIVAFVVAGRQLRQVDAKHRGLFC